MPISKLLATTYMVVIFFLNEFFDALKFEILAFVVVLLCCLLVLGFDPHSFLYFEPYLLDLA